MNITLIFFNVTFDFTDTFITALMNITLIPPIVISNLANIFGLSSPIYQPTIISGPA